MNNSNIRMQVLCALFAAFCAVCSQLTIPIQPVPITLGTFAVLLAGGLVLLFTFFSARRESPFFP